MGDFLKSRAIESLIEESLMMTEGGPTDSESLTWLFHFHGVNMRYLGTVLQRFRELMANDHKKLKYKHVEFLLEKEILVRSLKHTML